MELDPDTLFCEQAEEILNKKAGWKALTGTTDFSEIAEKASSQRSSSASDAKERHALAFDIFMDRILGFIGSYYLKLGGASQIDALVFSGGIGEHSAVLRRAVVERCAGIGLHIDEKKNSGANDDEGDVVDLGSDTGENGSVKVLLCRTDEQVSHYLSGVGDKG